jgi:hypothetical protein
LLHFEGQGCFGIAVPGQPDSVITPYPNLKWHTRNFFSEINELLYYHRRQFVNRSGVEVIGEFSVQPM